MVCWSHWTRRGWCLQTLVCPCLGILGVICKIMSFAKLKQKLQKSAQQLPIIGQDTTNYKNYANIMQKLPATIMHITHFTPFTQFTQWRFDLKLRKSCRYYADVTHKLRVNYPYSCTTTQQLRNSNYANYANCANNAITQNGIEVV